MVRFLLCLLALPLFAGTDDGSILLRNDTTVILTAVIRASDGRYLGQVTLQPGEQKNFTQTLVPTRYVRPPAPDVSMTPYTVIWQCPSEGIYSICDGVSPGAYVNATVCSGSHYCSPKKELPKK